MPVSITELEPLAPPMSVCAEAALGPLAPFLAVCADKTWRCLSSTACSTAKNTTPSTDKTGSFPFSFWELVPGDRLGEGSLIFFVERRRGETTGICCHRL
jgi:hypothetical protein